VGPAGNRASVGQGTDDSHPRAVEILTKEALRDALENLSYRERLRQIEKQSLKKLQNLNEA